MQASEDGTEDADVIIVGAGHNGLVAAVLLARAGLKTLVLEEREVAGGAVRTERPFRAAPELGASTGAYLLGLMPPELLQKLAIDLPLFRRDPHYFLPTRDDRYLLFGSDAIALERQFRSFFSEADWRADQRLQTELASLREDLAPSWLLDPLPLEETAERFIRKELRQTFVELCRGAIKPYLDRFGFRSDLLIAMYAVTDAFAGLSGGLDSPGTGFNFLAHNMCRLPGSGGSWMLVRGGMGTITQRLAQAAIAAGCRIRTGVRVEAIDSHGGTTTGVLTASGEHLSARAVVVNADPFRLMNLCRDALPADYVASVEAKRRPGTTFKLNLCLRELPRFTCLPEDRGQYGPTIHLLPDESEVLAELHRAHRQALAGELPEFPSIEWYIHTPVDPSLRGGSSYHSAALFVQWVPEKPAGSSWDREEERYARHLLSICDRFAPNTSRSVVEMQPLSPAGIERRFGITGGHIHHLDNSFGFTDRLPYAQPLSGLFSCSAGCHPAGAVVGAAGHNAAQAVLRALGLPPI